MIFLGYKIIKMAINRLAAMAVILLFVKGLNKILKYYAMMFAQTIIQTNVQNCLSVLVMSFFSKYLPSLTAL